MLEIPLLLLIIAFALVAFAMEWMPIDVVALSTLALLLLFNLITPQEAIAGFSNPAVIIVMMMFILSYALIHTGLISKLGHRIARLSGRSYWSAAVVLLLVAGALSAFISNTATVAVLMPVSIQLANHFRISPSKILLPLSYISIIAGTCTLVGTSTNILVSSLSEEHGLGAFTVFEFLSLGSILFVIGLAYIVAGPMRYLPSRAIISSLTRKYHMTAYLTELRVPEGSRLVGKTVVEEHVRERFELNVLEILRGRRKIAVDIRNTRLAPEDILIVRGAMEDILAFKEQYGLLLLTDIKLKDEDLSDEANILAEVQISPVSRLVGQTVAELDFRRAYGCFVLALNRTGGLIREKLASIPIRQWDTLLVFGPRHRVENLYTLDDFVPLQELELRLRLTRRWWVGLLIIPLVVIVAATGLMSLLKASILGAIALVISKTLTIQQAYKSINWTVIFLLAAIIPLGIAVEKTGLAALIGEKIAHAGDYYGPLAVVVLLYLVTTVLSEIVSNNATAVLMVPIAITAAHTVGVDTKPFLMAVTYAASASFLTPMGYQTNAMVHGPGGYRFLDYLKVGAPLKIIFWLVSVLLIPVIWPFEGS